jgi:hypothetical protein
VIRPGEVIPGFFTSVIGIIGPIIKFLAVFLPDINDNSLSDIKISE